MLFIPESIMVQSLGPKIKQTKPIFVLVGSTEGQILAGLGLNSCDPGQELGLRSWQAWLLWAPFFFFEDFPENLQNRELSNNRASRC